MIYVKLREPVRRISAGLHRAALSNDRTVTWKATFSYKLSYICYTFIREEQQYTNDIAALWILDPHGL